MIIHMKARPHIEEKVTARLEDLESVQPVRALYPWVGTSQEDGTVTFFSKDKWQVKESWVPAHVTVTRPDQEVFGIDGMLFSLPEYLRAQVDNSKHRGAIKFEALGQSAKGSITIRSRTNSKLVVDGVKETSDGWKTTEDALGVTTFYNCYNWQMVPQEVWHPAATRTTAETGTGENGVRGKYYTVALLNSPVCPYIIQLPPGYRATWVAPGVIKFERNECGGFNS